MSIRTTIPQAVFLNALVVFAFLAVAACSSGGEASGDVSSGPAEGDAIELVTRDNAFQPEELEVEAGEEVTIEVTNQDSVAHDFTVEPLDVSTGVLQSDEVATVTLTAAEGETAFVCELHPEMEGVLLGI